jgi:hypothetical protein
MPENSPSAPLKFDLVLRGSVGEQGFIALFAVERGEDRIGFYRLLPVDVAGMRRVFRIFRGVAVEDGAAERRVTVRVAVGAEGEVTPGQHELEFVRFRVAEQGDVIVGQARAVVLHLLLDTRVPFVRSQAAQDTTHHLLLLGFEFADGRLDDSPVRRNSGTFGMIPGHTQEFALLRRQALVQRLDQRFRLCQSFGLCRFLRQSREVGQSRRGQRDSTDLQADGSEELAAA